jgi:transcription termination factor Rho
MKHGRVFIDGGFRPAVIKEGPKWSQVVYINGTHVKVKRVKGSINVNPLHEKVTLRLLAQKLSCRTNCLGLPMPITKGARAILTEARS